QNKVRYGDVLFTGSSEIADEAGMSSAVTVHFEESVYLNSFSFGIRFSNSIKIKPEFAKYLFRTHFMRSEIAKTASGVTRFNISKSRFKKILVPIICPNDPEKSLAIQSEIVRILDKFSELTAELTAELNMRKKQYNYYRDQLLRFKEGEVEWKTLGEIGEFIRGKRFTKADYVEDGGISVIHYGEIYTRYGVYTTHSLSQVRADMAASLRYAKHGDVVITDVGETVEDVGKAVAWLGDDDIAIHDHCYAFRHSLNPKFISYYMQTDSFISEKAKYVARTKVNTLLINGFSKIMIPVPYPKDHEKSLKEQARIVAILDKFDTLTNSITEGLPREIELRQKQYEYYRDLLFSFPKPETVSN
ncbi:restriction endonuclease subunit S, partial [Escherichia coli]|nr:restriction endonuclease subunit S [Escherichia coli]